MTSAQNDKEKRSTPIRVEHLSLAHFRNYEGLDLDLPPGLVILVGDNAQGKTNLLEALFLLATGHSHRTESDREMIGWSAAREPIPYSRAAARVVSARGPTTVEVVMQLARSSGSTGGQEGAFGARERDGPQPAEQQHTLQIALDAPFLSATGEDPGPRDVAGGVLQKAFKVNAVRRRAADMVGTLTVVLAGPEEVELVGGPPAPRRRFLDLTNCQIDPAYLRALQRYQRVLTQRNALLRQGKERTLSPAEIAVWDQEMVQTGAYLLGRRARMLEALQAEIETTHNALADRPLPLRLDYRSTLGSISGLGETEIRQALLAALREARARDGAIGSTTVGPHRDDLRLLAGDVDLGVYGSRGQQRTLALALVLAQARYMRQHSGEEPVLLFDDPLSELDAHRRQRLLETCLAPGRQVLLSTADLDLIPPRLRTRASVFRVQGGQARPEPL